jgi:hypothetical protein
VASVAGRTVRVGRRSRRADVAHPGGGAGGRRLRQVDLRTGEVLRGGVALGRAAHPDRQQPDPVRTPEMVRTPSSPPGGRRPTRRRRRSALSRGGSCPRRRASRSTTDGPDGGMHPRSAPAGHLGVDRFEGASRGVGGGRSDGVAAGDGVAAVRRGGGGARHPRPGWIGVRRGAGAGGSPAGGPAAGCPAEGPPSAGSSRRSGRARRGTWVSHPGPAWRLGADATWCRSRGQVAGVAGRTVRVGRRSRRADVANPGGGAGADVSARRTSGQGRRAAAGSRWGGRPTPTVSSRTRSAPRRRRGLRRLRPVDVGRRGGGAVPRCRGAGAAPTVAPRVQRPMDQTGVLHPRSAREPAPAGHLER